MSSNCTKLVYVWILKPDFSCQSNNEFSFTKNCFPIKTLRKFKTQVQVWLKVFGVANWAPSKVPLLLFFETLIILFEFDFFSAEIKRSFKKNQRIQSPKSFKKRRKKMWRRIKIANNILRLFEDGNIGD